MSGHTKTVNGKLVATIVGSPLDYGWKELKSFKDVVEEEPWTKAKEAAALAEMKKKMDARRIQNEVAGDSKSVEDGTVASAAAKKEETKKAVAEGGQQEGDVGAVVEAVEDKPLRSKSHKLILKEQIVSIKFNNNEINTWEGFDEGLATAMAYSKGLQFLDASFNKLQTIGTCLSEYADLRVLYLHGNAISRLKDIDRLKSLKQIRKLTLHGNPVEDNKNYRKYVIYALPSLQQLDFTPITGLDRDHAKTWAEREIRNRERRREGGAY
jgi:hypothetical protein